MRTSLRRALLWAPSLLLLAACASSVTLTDPPLAKLSVAGASTSTRVKLASLSGDPCFRKEVLDYLRKPGGLRLAETGEESDLTLSGELRRLEVHSNRGDKEVSLIYFTAFIVTAPIAAVMYGAKDWHADAAAEGKLEAVDRAGATLWSKELTVSLSETQRTMPTAEALKTAMSAGACQKLATTLLNALAEELASRRGPR
jgi:hypothetical protein